MQKIHRFGIYLGTVVLLLGLIVAVVFGCGQTVITTIPGLAGGSSDNLTFARITVEANAGDQTAESFSVGIEIGAADSSGITGFYISEEAAAPALNAGGWNNLPSAETSFSIVVPYNLSGEAGTKIINVWFKNAGGDVSGKTTTSIYVVSGAQVDKQPPTNMAMGINNGETSTTSSEVTINLAARDNSRLISYFASEGLVTPETKSYVWISFKPISNLSQDVKYMLSGTGTKIIYVWFRDAGGNISTPVAGTITFTSDEGGILPIPSTDATVVHGRVHSSTDPKGPGIGGATVTAEGCFQTIVSQNNGDYAIGNAPIGRYKIYAYKIGYRPTFEVITLELNQDLIQDLYIEPIP